MTILHSVRHLNILKYVRSRYVLNQCDFTLSIDWGMYWQLKIGTEKGKEQTSNVLREMKMEKVGSVKTTFIIKGEKSE